MLTNFEINLPSKIYKSSEDEKRINIEIVVSEPTPDSENDLLSLEAFNEPTVKSYLDTGVIDFDHQTVRGKTILDKSRAIIGQPTHFYIKDKKPCIKGYLFKNNPFVRDAIYPALQEDSKVFKASIGGGIIAKAKVYLEKLKKAVNKITEILWNHTAITPAFKAVHPNTKVQLVKSFGGNTYIEINDDNVATWIFDGLEPFNKALVAGFETDMAKISGGQTFTKPSLEDGFYEGIKYIEMSKQNLSFDDIVDFYVQHGFSKDEALKMAMSIALNKSEIIKILKE